MTAEAKAGPIIQWGQQPPIAAGFAPPDYNPDGNAPNFGLGWGLLDIRFGYKLGGSGGGSITNCGFAPGANYVSIDQIPSAATTANIAALANVTNGTPMVLVAVAGAGISILAAALFIPQTGLTVPKGTLVIDLAPANLTFGQNANVSVWDPTKTIARALSITGAVGSAGATFLVSGFDMYGQPQTETIVAAAAATTNGKKGWKFITSVLSKTTDAHNYSVGTSDIFEFPLRADSYGYLDGSYGNVPITNPNFVAADTTSPATATTGSVRGTMNLGASPSDGVKRITMMQGVSPSNITTAVGTYGVTPA